MHGFVKAALAALLLAGPGAGAAAAADASAWSATPEASSRLLAAATAVGQAAALRLGLEIELAPGWKTYWRSPGEAGAPPRLDWSGSTNVAAVELRWPAPERFHAFGLESYGYGGQVVLPLTLRPAEPGRPVAARLLLDYQVCKDICIPVAAELALELPAGPPASSPHAGLIARFERQVPLPNGADGIAIDAPRLGRDEAGPALFVTVRAEPPLAAPLLIVEAPPALGLGRPAARQAGAGEARFRVAVEGDGAALVGQPLGLTLIDGARAREARLTVTR